MAKPNYIELPGDIKIPILYEDRSVLAIDKPHGWMLVPFSWQNTGRNLQAALASSIAAHDFWAGSRSLKFLRFVHRLDAETTGILLMAKSPGAVHTYGRLFESRQMEKIYLAVVQGTPKRSEWNCRLKLGTDPSQRGRIKVDLRHGKEAETLFRVLQAGERTTLVEVRPLTGRTHQIRVHLAESGHPVIGDELYGGGASRNMIRGGLTSGRSQEGNCPKEVSLGLRAVGLSYSDPFTSRRVQIRAALEKFVREYGFQLPYLTPQP